MHHLCGQLCLTVYRILLKPFRRGHWRLSFQILVLRNSLLYDVDAKMVATSLLAPRFLPAFMLSIRLIYFQNDPGLCLKPLDYCRLALFINTASPEGFCGYCQSHVLRPPDRHIGVELENIQIRTLAKAKRARAPTKLYPDSSLTFHPLIKLVHEIELNPGPQNFSVKESGGKNANSMK